tara:strand:- start:149 stop:901 length:753 start_codon:yes stop_codon:yes gene_type:complete
VCLVVVVYTGPGGDPGGGNGGGANGGGGNAAAGGAPALGVPLLATANHPKNTYINNTGYTANARLAFGTAALTNGTLAFPLHVTAAAVTTNLKILFSLARHSALARHSGTTQYPNSATDCKKMILPPNNNTFAVSATAPIPTVAKTTLNVSCPSGTPALSVALSVNTNTSGPHSSHSRNRVAPFAPQFVGISTAAQLRRTSAASRRTVAHTVSSNVSNEMSLVCDASTRAVVISSLASLENSGAASVNVP